MCFHVRLGHARERRALLVFQSIVSEVCGWGSLGLCVLSNNTALPQPICLCICDRFAHTVTALVFSSMLSCTHTHTHAPPPLTCPSLPPLTHLLSSDLPLPLCLSTCRRQWQGCSSAVAVGGSPFVFAKSGFAGDLIPPVLLSLQQEEVAELLSVGCQGWTVQAQIQRYNVEHSGPSGKSLRVKSSFRRLLSYRSSTPCSEKATRPFKSFTVSKHKNISNFLVP